MTVTKFSERENKCFDDYPKIADQILLIRQEIDSLQKSLCNLRKDLFVNGLLKPERKKNLQSDHTVK